MRPTPALPLTNKQFAERDETFRRACELAGIPATTRQASKWRDGRGSANKFRTAAIISLQREFAVSVGGAR